MTRHLLCLTIDTDPDGLSGVRHNRGVLEWNGLARVGRLLDELDALSASMAARMPVTWFVRADGQLRDILGDTLYLINEFSELWDKVTACSHELAWHPHLYRQPARSAAPCLISDPLEACEELTMLWEDVRTVGSAWRSFRNGEGWHCAETLALIEELGFVNDSTALPGLKGDDNPMDWRGSPNHPFFPLTDRPCTAGPERRLLELPMNTWLVNAPYDTSAKRRYMNPAVHEAIFRKSVDVWSESFSGQEKGFYVWVLVCHPDEVMEQQKPSPLFAYSPASLRRNLQYLCQAIQRNGQHFEFANLAQAGDKWRAHYCRQPGQH